MQDDSAVRNFMIKELKELKSKHTTPRRTRIEDEVEDLEAIDLIKNSKSVIVMTKGGYIKRMPLSDFQSQQRGTRGKTGVSATKSNAAEEDNENAVEHCFSCNDHDTLIFSTLKGIAYGLRTFQIPVSGRTARGVPLPSVLPVSGDDVVASVLPVPKFSKDEFIVLATEKGWIKKTPLAAFENISSRGLIIASLEEGDSLKWVSKCTDEMDVFLGSEKGMATRYSASLLRPTARTSRGVRSMKLRPGDAITGMSVMEAKVRGGGKGWGEATARAVSNILSSRFAHDPLARRRVKGERKRSTSSPSQRRDTGRGFQSRNSGAREGGGSELLQSSSRVRMIPCAVSPLLTRKTKYLSPRRREL